VVASIIPVVALRLAVVGSGIVVAVVVVEVQVVGTGRIAMNIHVAVAMIVAIRLIETRAAQPPW